MSVEPFDDGLDELRRLRDRALADTTGDGLVDEYEQGAIMMSWTKVAGQRQTLTDTLRVTLLGAHHVDSYTAGTVSRAVQNAVARIDKSARLPGTTTLGISTTDRHRAEVIQQAQLGNTVYFRVPAVALPPGGYDIGVHPGRAGSAIRELVETLPATPDDDKAVDGILGAPRLMRLAIQDISKAAKLSPEGLELDLETEREKIQSVLTRDRATELDRYLGDKDIVEDEDTEVGVLDGFRGTRRVFYLIRDDGTEIAGSIEGDLLPRVHSLVGKRVRARVSTTQWRARSGRPGTKRYGLLDLQPDGEQRSMFDESD